MGDCVFISAVTDEFHRPDRLRPQSFTSYRAMLKQALRVWNRECQLLDDVVDQEGLHQGLGDLLSTLDAEIARSTIVIHLVGDMAGACPQPRSLRLLRERYAPLLGHEPELAAAIGDGTDISYTQWEAYLAYQHGCGRLFYQPDATAPRSPHFRRDSRQQSSQSQHLQRLKITGEFPETIASPRELAQKAIASIERFGLSLRAKQAAPLDPQKKEQARAEAASLAFDIGNELRSAAAKALSEYDPAGIEAYLRSIDTVALRRELDRRAALEVVFEHREQLQQAVQSAPTAEGWYDVAFAELALAHYREAMNAAETAAELALQQMPVDAALVPQHRERAMNAFLLQYEAAQLAGLRDEAIASLERGAALIDREKEPVLWADYHETLARYLLDHAQYDRAEAMIDEIIDIREDQGEGSSALPNSLLLWCLVLDSRADYKGLESVASRAERLFSRHPHKDLNGISGACSYKAQAFQQQGRFQEAEIALKQALSIAESHLGPRHANVGAILNSLAVLFQNTNRSSEAEPFCRRALAIAEDTLGPAHPEVGTALNNLAATLQDTGRWQEAELLLQKSLKITEAYFGVNHPEVAQKLNNLATLHFHQEQLTEAEDLLRKALAIDERMLGQQHPTVAMILNNLVSVLVSNQRYAEAEPLMRRAVQIFHDAYGDEHPRTQTFLKNYASLLLSGNSSSE